MALTKISNNSLSAISSLPASIPTGALTLLSTQTASASASIEFTSGLDSTYDSYIFKMIDIHPETNGSNITFQCSTDSGSTYATTVTSTYFQAFHFENDSGANLEYAAAKDLAQSTSFQNIATGIGSDNDQNYGGSLQLYNPSSDTFVKHFIVNGNSADASDITINQIPAGYFNTTSAIDAIQFKMSSGNFDGIIKMYGVS
jgi:hypothetical protein